MTAPSNTRIEILETGRYEFRLEEGVCVADVKRSRNFDLVPPQVDRPTPPAVSNTAVAPAPSARPEPPQATDCSASGPPARLEVTPARKLLRTGESFVFRALVRDARGCPTSMATTWSVAQVADRERRVTVDASGKVTALDDAPEGSAEVLASAASKSAKVIVVVTSPARYDALLAQSGLNAAGESEGAAVAVIATGSLGGAGVMTRDHAKTRKAVFVTVVGLLVGALGAVALIGARRARQAARLEREALERHNTRTLEAERRKRERLEQHATQMRAHIESVARAAQAGAAGGELACPACRRQFPAGSQYCPFDGNQLVAVAGNEEMLVGPAGVICPACGRGFNPGTTQCPFDHEALVPYPVYAAAVDHSQPLARGKICPTCGERFDGSASFCGTDGTALVLVN